MIKKSPPSFVLPFISLSFPFSLSFFRGIIVPPCVSPPAAPRPLRLQTPYHLTFELINIEHGGVQVALTRGALGGTRWEDTSHCNPFALLKLYGLSSPKYTEESLSRRFSAHTDNRNHNLSTFLFSVFREILVKIHARDEEKAIKSAIANSRDQLCFSRRLVAGREIFSLLLNNLYSVRILIRLSEFRGEK